MRRFTALLVIALLAATLVSFAVAPGHGWWFPKNVGVFGARVDELFALVTWIISVFLVGTLALLAWCVWRGVGPGRALFTHGSRRLEVAWTIVPALILAFLAVAQLDAWKELRYASRRPDKPVHAQVWASQFDWHFVYPGKDARFGTMDDLDAPFELVVPANEPVVLELHSRDVIHSFFVPALRLKQDVVPGLAIPIWFEARETGTFDVECSQLCGFGHTWMVGRLRIVTRPEFDAYAAELERAQHDNGQGAR